MLEVVAKKEVFWHYNMAAKVGSRDTLRAAFSHMFVQAKHLRVVCHWPHGVDNPPADGPSAEEALIGVIHCAPPTLRSCSLSPLLQPDDTEQTWDLQLKAEYNPSEQVFDYNTEQYYFLRYQDRLFHTSAEKLAAELQPFARDLTSTCRLTRKFRKCS